jgi:WD40 repeat protein
MSEAEPSQRRSPWPCLLVLVVLLGAAIGGALFFMGQESGVAKNGAAILEHPELSLVTGLSLSGGNVVVVSPGHQAWLETPRGLEKGPRLFGESSKTLGLLQPRGYDPEGYVYVLDTVLKRESEPLGPLILAGAEPIEQELRRVVRVFERETGSVVWESGFENLAPNKHSIHQIAWTEGRVATGAEDGRVDVYDSGTGELELTLREPARGSVSALTFDATGERVAAGLHLVEGVTNQVRVWEVKSGEELLRIEAEKGVTALAFSEQGQRLAVGDGVGDLRVYGSEGVLERTLAIDSAGLLKRESFHGYFVEAILFRETEVVWGVYRRVYRYDLGPFETGRAPR